MQSNPAYLGARSAVQTTSPHRHGRRAFVRAARLPPCPLLQSLLRVEQTWLFALQMSAFDPKRTSAILDHRGMSHLISS